MTPGPREGTSRPRRKMTARSYSRRILRPLSSSTNPINTTVTTESRPPITLSPFCPDPAEGSLDNRPVSSCVARHRRIPHGRNISTPSRRIGLFYWCHHNRLWSQAFFGNLATAPVLPPDICAPLAYLAFPCFFNV